MAQNFETIQDDIVDGGGSSLIYIYNDAKRILKNYSLNIGKAGQDFINWDGWSKSLFELYSDNKERKDFEAKVDMPANSKDVQKHINKLWSELTQVSLKFQRDKYSEINDRYVFLPASSPVHTFGCDEYSVDLEKIFIKDEGGDITINKPTLGEYAMAIEMAISDMELKMEQIDRRAQGAMNRIAGRKLSKTHEKYYKEVELPQADADLEFQLSNLA